MLAQVQNKNKRNPTVSHSLVRAPEIETKMICFTRYTSGRLVLLLDMGTATLFPASAPSTTSIYVSKTQPCTWYSERAQHILATEERREHGDELQA